jgi:hypothetical protein
MDALGPSAAERAGDAALSRVEGYGDDGLSRIEAAGFEPNVGRVRQQA